MAYDGNIDDLRGHIVLVRNRKTQRPDVVGRLVDHYGEGTTFKYDERIVLSPYLTLNVFNQEDVLAARDKVMRMEQEPFSKLRDAELENPLSLGIKRDIIVATVLLEDLL